MKPLAVWTFVVVWFTHLALGAGAGFAVLRLWEDRKNPFILRVAIYMHAAVVGALMAIVLVFMAKGIKLTWKFSITWFAGTLLMDALRVPLILYIVKGNRRIKKVESGGGLPPLE